VGRGTSGAGNGGPCRFDSPDVSEVERSSLGEPGGYVSSPYAYALRSGPDDIVVGSDISLGEGIVGGNQYGGRNLTRWYKST
jgi:hypothetical protein